MNIPPHEVFLYRGKWSPQADDLLLPTTVRVKAQLNMSDAGIPDAAIVEAEMKMGSKFNRSELEIRAEMYEARYRTFKMVVATLGASWDNTNKIINAEPDVWQGILRLNPFAGAYYYHDEPDYARLAILFGLDDVKEEDEDEPKLVVLSDTTTNNREVIVIDDSEDVDTGEVNSPAMVLPTKARRKLFLEDEDSLDRESTNLPPPFYYTEGLDGGLVRKMAFSLGRPLRAPPSNAKSSPGVSSCASCSPFSSASKPTP